MELKHLNAQEFEAVKSGSQPALIDFSAVWCGPCKMLAPVLEQLAERYEGKAVVAKVDVDEQGALAARFGIQSIPTVMIFRDGAAIDTMVGAHDYDTYAAALERALAR